MTNESRVPEYKDLDEAYLAELGRVLDVGVDVSPRELLTLERTDSVLRLRDPRARLIHTTARRWSLHYAIGEMLWHFSGSYDLAFISYYSDVWNRFTDDGRTIQGSCYGRKIFGALESGVSRWDSARRLLQADPDTRRCVITLYDPVELAGAAEAKDIPCCNMLQFLVRDGKLCLTVYMRSNDLMYGFVYDIFLFTMLQELMAVQLQLPIGWYQHVAGSLHIYNRDINWARRIANSLKPVGRPMPAMTNPDELPTVLKHEEFIRLADELDPTMKFNVSPFWDNILVALLFHKLRRLREYDEMMIAAKRLDGTCFESVISVFL